MIDKIKNLSRKQIIIIASSVVVLSSAGVGAAVMLTNDNNNSEEKDKMCLVEFDTSGGSTIESKEIICGNKITEPESKPEKLGFEFVNWTYNESEFDFNTIINNNIVLIANYNKTTDEEILTVTFNSNGGSEVKAIELVKGTTISEPVRPTYSGYSFDGWYIDENTKFDFTQVINENITLVAKWTKDKVNQSTGSSSNVGNNTSSGNNTNNGTSGNQGNNSGSNNNQTVTPTPNPEPTPEPDPTPNPKPETPTITKITVDKSEINGTIGETYDVYVKVYSGKTGLTPIVTSSDESVATVVVREGSKIQSYDGYGLKITVKGYGTATITIKSPDGSVQTTVKVSNPYYPVTGITLSDYNLTLHVGESYTISATVNPSNATTRGVIWDSDNVKAGWESLGYNGTNVFKLVVKGYEVGTTVITAKALDNGLTASCTVTVIE